MKKKNTLRLLLGASLIVGAGAAMSSCADMWMSTTTGFDFTQPGGFGLDIGVGGPIGHHRLPPPPQGGPWGSPGGLGWGPGWGPGGGLGGGPTGPPGWGPF